MDYESYWEKRPEVSLRRRHTIIADALEEGSTVLELGCGDGKFLKYIDQNKNVNSEGIDLSTKAIETAKLRGVNARPGDATTLDLENRTYDYIIAIELLEHVVESEKILKLCKSHFKKNLIVSTPNTGYWKYRTQLLAGHFPKQWLYHPSEHLRFWTFSDFTEWVKINGYDVESYRSAKGTPLLEHIIPSLFSMSVVWFLKERGNLI